MYTVAVQNETNGILLLKKELKALSCPHPVLLQKLIDSLAKCFLRTMGHQGPGREEERLLGCGDRSACLTSLGVDIFSLGVGLTCLLPRSFVCW